MVAAIYARKSTEQVGVADEQKSVARQVGARPRVRHQERLDRRRSVRLRR